MLPQPLLNSMICIRPATVEDVPGIASLIKELAAYEKLSHEAVVTEESLKQTLFGPHPYAEVLLAADGEETVGFCLFFHNYSTFLGKPGIYIEDAFVQPDYRGRSIGTLLFEQVFTIARDRGCGRVEWSVLDWNKPAIDFYTRMGAKPMNEWTIYRLTEEQFS